MAKPKKKWTVEERAAFAAKMKERRAAKAVTARASPEKKTEPAAPVKPKATDYFL